MSDLPAAGTPDRRAAILRNGFSHFLHDVDTYELAKALGRLEEYGHAKVRPPSQGGGTCFSKMETIIRDDNLVSEATRRKEEVEARLGMTVPDDEVDNHDKHAINY